MSCGLWFEGAVEESVSFVRESNGHLVALLEDESDESNALVSAWESKSVVDFIQENLKGTCVCIRVKNGTKDGDDLKAAFTGLNAPVAVVFDTVSSKIVSQLQPPCSAEDVLSVLLTLVQKTETNKGKAVETSSSSSSAVLPSESEKQQKSKEERQKEMEEKLRAVRQKKAKQKLQEEKEKEKQRREQQKGLQSAKETYQQHQVREMAEKRRLERVKQKKRLAKIKEQIIKDHQKQTESFSDHSPTSTSTAPSQTTATRGNRNEQKGFDECIVSLRMPDGSSETLTVPPSASVADLYSRVREIIGGVRDFVILTAYPSTELNAEDDTTVLSLGFCPRVRLIVRLCALPPRQVSMCEGVVKFVYALFCSPKPNDNDDEDDAAEDVVEERNETPTSSQAPRPGRDAASIRQRRIARLGDMDKNENKTNDDNNDAYNGNSTQFHM
eukprot:m.117741 g.117741  ORF g.117741 m.117741 type:complete len:442 (-) comp12880_c0_seq1:1089-2414(-)